MGTDLEIELKFLVEGVAGMRRRLAAAGPSDDGRCFEINYRYDDPDGSLLRRGMLLRLRRDRSARVTVKLPHTGGDPRFKIYRELEVEVSDPVAMDRILSAVGFLRVQIYEKWRETFRVDDALVCLDELPYGAFLEIEGPPASIRRLSARLGLDWERRIRANYLEIFEAVRPEAGITGNDLTFEALAGLEAKLPPLIRRFEAGAGRP